MVAAPSFARILIALEMVMVCELEPALLMKMGAPVLTALTPWARVLKGRL
jgi:hypothetical protein